MAHDLKTQWVKALRSGEYTQMYGRLSDGVCFNVSRRFCAIGVLADIAVKNPAYRMEWTDGGTRICDALTDECMTVNEIGARVGLDKKRVDRIIKANDSYALPFDKIANIIERWV